MYNYIIIIAVCVKTIECNTETHISFDHYNKNKKQKQKSYVNDIENKEI